MQTVTLEPYRSALVSDDERNQMIGKLVSDRAEAKKALTALNEKLERLADWLQKLGYALANPRALTSEADLPRLMSYSAGLGVDLSQLQSMLDEKARLTGLIADYAGKLISFGIPE